MPTDEQKREIRRDMRLAAVLIAAGTLIAGVSLATLIAREPDHMAQPTQKPGGTRPTTPAPEPAHPDPQAQSEGARPALPLAPAEKMAPPLNPSAKEK